MDELLMLDGISTNHTPSHPLAPRRANPRERAAEFRRSSRISRLRPAGGIDWQAVGAGEIDVLRVCERAGAVRRRDA